MTKSLNERVEEYATNCLDDRVEDMQLTGQLRDVCIMEGLCVILACYLSPNTGTDSSY